MKTTHHIVSHEMGKIRIYLAPRDRMPAKGLLGRLGARPVYREIIAAAKKAGLHSAIAFTSHHGFSNGGRIGSAGAEGGNGNLTLCVEIIDHKDALEAFCRSQGALLKGRPIVYKHVEHWTMKDADLQERDAPPDEVIDGGGKSKLGARS